MKYEDYVDLTYKPSKNDVICEFVLKPRGNMVKAAGAVAAESSIGTWTETTTTKPAVYRLSAKVYEIKGRRIKIAYPSGLFEKGNLLGLMSSVMGNVFGMKEVRSLKLVDLILPRKIVKNFKGPRYGIRGVRRVTGIKKRPLLGTIIKPKVGLNAREHARVAYEAWVGGCDIVKDDENLTSQSFNKFEKRLKETLKMKERAERETGEKKFYMINVTAETFEMLRRAKLVEKSGNEYVMVDSLIVGFSSLLTLRDRVRTIIHAHRAGHGALTRGENGVSMKVLAKLIRLCGCDQLHVGTVVGKMFEGIKEVKENLEAVRGEMYGIKPIMPVASGGLNQKHVPKIVEIFGNDVIIQMGGGIHGMKTRIGAAAARQAIDAVMNNVSLKEYARTHEELRAALRKWK